MHDSGPKPEMLPQRLCSEIKLFDLCDVDVCNHINGRYCTNPELLSRFEKIAENELKVPGRFVSEEFDDAEADDGDGEGYDGEFTMENFEDGEGDGLDDEE